MASNARVSDDQRGAHDHRRSRASGGSSLAMSASERILLDNIRVANITYHADDFLSAGQRHHEQLTCGAPAASRRLLTLGQYGNRGYLMCIIRE